LHIAKFAVNRRTTILMMVLAVVLIGGVSFSRLPVDLLPNMNFPMAAVMADYSGAAPEEVETMVTKPLEAVLGTLTNVEQVQSMSNSGSALVLISFNWGTNMDMMSLDIREKVDLAKRYLPSGVNINVIKFDPSMLPVMEIGMSSNTLDLLALRNLAEDGVSQRLERIPGVASVTVNGGVQQEYHVDLNQAKLEEYGISLSQVTNVLRAASVNLPGGAVTSQGNQYLIRTIGRVQTIADMEGLIVGAKTTVTMPTTPSPPAGATGSMPTGQTGSLPSGASGLPAGAVTPQPQVKVTPIQLKDVAAVSLVNQQAGGLSRLNGEPNVTLSLQKQSDANTVSVASAVRAELSKIQTDYPDLTLIPTIDQSEFINAAIGTVAQSALLGGILAIIILLIFLRSLRSTLIIAVAAPVSIISTFILMYFSHLTMNLMTLSGLALGVGMLVDNAIVVLENTFRHLELGESRKVAAERGAREVAMAITTSTLTTVAVFLPVVFVGGITGTLFKELALTVSFSLAASLVVALTVVPMLGASLLKTNRSETSIGRLATTYGRALRWTMAHKLPVIALVLALFAGSMFTIPKLGGEFLPSMDMGELQVSIALDGGSADELDQIVTDVEQALLATPDVKQVDSNINGSSLVQRNSSGNQATVHALLQAGHALSTDQVIQDLRQQFPKDYRGATVSIDSGGLMGMGGGAASLMLGGNGVTVDILGPDLDQLAQYANALGEKMAQLGYFQEIKNSLAESQSELQVQVDFEKAGQFGLAPALVGSAVRSAFQGDIATQINHGGKDLSVIVRLRESDRQNLADLKNLILQNTNGRVVRLSDVAQVVEAQGPTQITRVNNQRQVTVSAAVVGRDLSSAQEELEQLVDEMNLPDNYSAVYNGQLKQMNEAFSGLTLALVLAVILVYMVMASQFESLIHPFTVMFTMPLAAIGVIFLLFFTHQTLNVPSLIGVIMLAGIVVNNAIVLVDYINQLRSRGVKLEEAVIEAGETRLRPVLMTALTTILGLIPLAVIQGDGAEMQRPLAIAVIGGLVTATFLTLFIIPIVYTAFDRLLPKATNIVGREEVVAD
jgi:HAE1 family hydrophobic/amphiphilic exporter-1